jgi:hypothetical protein
MHQSPNSKTSRTQPAMPEGLVLGFAVGPHDTAGLIGVANAGLNASLGLH